MKSLYLLVLVVCAALSQGCMSETDMHFRTEVLYGQRGRQQVYAQPQGQVYYQEGPPPQVMMQAGPPMRGQPVGPGRGGVAMVPTNVYVGGGALTATGFHTESLLVITQYGSQRVVALVDGNNNPVIVKDQQGPPPGVAGLTEQDRLAALPIDTAPPGHPPIYTPVWVVAPRQ